MAWTLRLRLRANYGGVMSFNREDLTKKLGLIFTVRLGVLAYGLLFTAILYLSFTHQAGGWSSASEDGNNFFRNFYTAAVIPYVLLLILTYTSIKPPKHLWNTMSVAVAIAFFGYAAYGHSTALCLLGGVLTNYAAVAHYSMNHWLKT